eukprot:scaffold1514_cov118-Cylindrotheca_fusiformis.AAC.11
MPSREEEDKQIKQRERNARVQVVPDLSKAMSDRFDISEPSNESANNESSPEPATGGQRPPSRPGSRNRSTRQEQQDSVAKEREWNARNVTTTSPDTTKTTLQEQDAMAKHKEGRARNISVVPDLASKVDDHSTPASEPSETGRSRRYEQDVEAKNRERRTRNISVVPDLASKVDDHSTATSEPSETGGNRRREQDIEMKNRERQARNISVVPDLTSREDDRSTAASESSETGGNRRHEQDVKAKNRERQARNISVVPNLASKVDDHSKATSEPSESGGSRCQEHDVTAKNRERQARNISVVPDLASKVDEHSKATSEPSESGGSRRQEQDVEAKHRERQSRNPRVLSQDRQNSDLQASHHTADSGLTSKSRHEEEIEAKRKERQTRNAVGVVVPGNGRGRSEIHKSSSHSTESELNESSHDNGRERQPRNARAVPAPAPKSDIESVASNYSSRHEEEIETKNQERELRNASRIAATQSETSTERDGRVKQQEREGAGVSALGGVPCKLSDNYLSNTDLVKESVDVGTTEESRSRQPASASTEKERVSHLPPSSTGQQPVYIGALSVNTESNTAVLRPTTALPRQPHTESTEPELFRLEEEPNVEAEHAIIIDAVEQGPPEVFAQGRVNDEGKDEEQGLSRRCWIIIGVVFLAVIGGAVGGALAAGGDSSENPASTIPPATESPLSERFIEGQSLLTDVSSQKSLSDRGSAQFNALSWLADIDTGTPMEDGEQLRSRYIMAVFYYSLDGPSWVDTTNEWLSEADECSWNGVTCNTENQLQSIVLDSFMNIAGTVPSELQLTMPFSTETLDLKKNNVAGLGAALSSLKTLDLSENGMQGNFPSAIYEMTNLEQLYMQTNQMTGSVAADLSSLVNLRRLNLSTNPGLGGNFASVFGGLVALERLESTETVFTGSADVGALKQLSYLDAGGNRLSGSLPSSLFGLTNLAALFLGLNDLSGGISTEIGQLSNIQRLSLAKNSLGGSIPSEIGQLTRMIELQLSAAELTGTIPIEIGNCTRLAGE